MKKINYIDILNLNKTHEGFIYKDRIGGLDLISRSKAIELIDRICSENDLKQLGDRWNVISVEEFDELLCDSLRYDLGFGNELLSENLVAECRGILVNDIDLRNCVCLTNWFSNFWRSGSLSANSIDNHTFSIALSLVDRNSLIFVYFFFDD